MSRILYHIALILSLAPVLHPQHLTITHLNVGQGDATVIQVKNGHTVLIDAGKPGMGEAMVLPFLQALGITHLDAIIASHYHADHIGGIPEVIEGLSPESVKCVIDRGNQTPLPPSQIFKQYLSASGDTPYRRAARPGHLLRLGASIMLSCLAANGEVMKNGIVALDRKNENDLSLAWVLTATRRIQDRTFVFRYFSGGDCGGYGGRQTDIETPIAAVAGNVDVIKVNHHGSRLSTNQTFLNALHPRIAVISVGDGNTYGHPSIESLNRLQHLPTLKDIYQTEKGSGATVPKAKIVGNVTISVYDSFFVAHHDTFPLNLDTTAVSLKRNHPDPDIDLQILDPQNDPTRRLLMFRVNQPTRFSVSVHNILGQTVASFGVRDFDEGLHTLTLEPFRIPAGVYFAVFQSASVRIVRKLPLLP